MKKLIFLLLLLPMLAACGQKLENTDITGSWDNEQATLYFNEDGSYEIKYNRFDVGELSSENGKYELSPGKVELKLRDKYILNELGEIDFKRLVRTENRKADIELNGDTLTFDGEEYARRDIY